MQNSAPNVESNRLAEDASGVLNAVGLYRLSNSVKNYAWGSRTALATLLGQATPSVKPEAEMWMGAHPSDPSFILRDGQRESSLLERIQADAPAAIGPNTAARFGSRLPYLLKVLAADEPLSLQAHPSAERARRGFDREEAADIPVAAAHRLFKDPYHKPELLCAVTPFEALCGFRQPEKTSSLFSELKLPALDGVAQSLASGNLSQAVQSIFEGLLRLDEAERSSLIRDIGEACTHAAAGPSQFVREHLWGARLASLYPGDAGVVVAMTLNLVRLAPWEAMFLQAGELHAYLNGVGIEIMASSDNVLRGGLTQKHVDIDALLSTLRFEPLTPAPVSTYVGVDGDTVFATPSEEFRLSRVAIEPGRVFAPQRRAIPEILLCWEGCLAVNAYGALGMDRGDSLFVAASSPPYSVTGSGLLIRATTGTA